MLLRLASAEAEALDGSLDASLEQVLARPKNGMNVLKFVVVAQIDQPCAVRTNAEIEAHIVEVCSIYHQRMRDVPSLSALLPSTHTPALPRSAMYPFDPYNAAKTAATTTPAMPAPTVTCPAAPVPAGGLEDVGVEGEPEPPLSPRGAPPGEGVRHGDAVGLLQASPVVVGEAEEVLPVEVGEATID